MLNVAAGAEHQRDVVAWLNAGLSRPGKTTSGLAGALGLDPSVVSRMKRGRRHLKAYEFPLVEAYFGEITVTRAMLPTVTLITLADGRKAAASTKNVHASVPTLIDGKYNGMTRHAVEVADDSFDRIIPKGGHAVYVPYWEARAVLTEGDIVVIEVRHNGFGAGRKGNHSTTTHIRRVARIGIGMVFTPETRSKKRYRVLTLPAGHGNQVTIIGKVISFVTDVT